MADKATLKDLEGALVTRITQTKAGVSLALSTEGGTLVLDIAPDSKHEALIVDIRRPG